jgi:hypothetical protein
MNPSLLKPVYQSKPIASVGALARCLKIEEQELRRLSEEASSLYRVAKPIVKADGSIRRPFDAKPPLKRIQDRIKTEIFSNVLFPPYLTGSLKGHDYVTNAELHVNKKVVICEDIQNFFPSVSHELVYDVWLRCLNFSPDVAAILTKLTVKDRALPQGAITSSYLANLALFRWEPRLHGELAERGISYSRFVDDIAISAPHFFSKQELTRLIRRVYGMLACAGLKAKRKKHEIFTSKNPMFATKLLVNKRVALPEKERGRIRAAVNQAEKMQASGAPMADLMKAMNTAAGRVATLGRFHKAQAAPLKGKLRVLRECQLSADFTTWSD